MRKRPFRNYKIYNITHDATFCFITVIFGYLEKLNDHPSIPVEE